MASFDPEGDDEGLGTLALVRVLVARTSLPVIAAGGIMDGAGIAAALALGAQAAQLGTAFVACDESSADAAYRAALTAAEPRATALTRAISGRAAQGFTSRFTALGVAPGAPKFPTTPSPTTPARPSTPRPRPRVSASSPRSGPARPYRSPALLPAGALVAQLTTELREALDRLSSLRTSIKEGLKPG